MTKPLAGMRIVVCGKGGCGKSTLVALMAKTLAEKGYEVHVIDGDASNPGLHWMLGFDEAPEPLIDFYGGKVFAGGSVGCPVDDPMPLQNGNINLEQLPKENYVQQNGITLYTAGKIKDAYEGCDGPESKIARDFSVPGDHVTLVDVMAGLEHFGRGVEATADAIITVVDPTATSFFIAKMAKDMVEGIKRGENPFTAHMEKQEDVEMARKIALEAKTKYAWTVLNKVNSPKMKSLMERRLEEHGIKPLASLRYDDEIVESSIEYDALRASEAQEDVADIIDRMEEAVEQPIEQRYVVS